MLREVFRPVAHAFRSALGINGLTARLTAIESLVASPTHGAVTMPAPENPPGPVAVDINLLLHQCRGALLRRMPRGARRLLSAGCAGGWYFDWIANTYGPVEQHLGIEFYAPKPESLPDNVTWIANTASNMSAVADRSCDLVFSGQNLEHLWPEEVAGFLLEAARVIPEGGHLVVDSPNRLLTAPLNWSHPEHTLELTPDEMCGLFQLAGFEVTARKGIWLCRDPEAGSLLPFDPNTVDPRWSMIERIAAAQDHPDQSFIWWIEGRRTGDPPDGAAIRAAMDELSRLHWPERTQRLQVPPGRVAEPRGDATWVVMPPGEAGVAFFGPYMPLRKGRYRCSWALEPQPGATGPYAMCDVLSGTSSRPLAQCEALPGADQVSIEFSLADTCFGLQFRCIGTGGAGFSVCRAVKLETLPS